MEKEKEKNNFLDHPIYNEIRNRISKYILENNISILRFCQIF